MRREATRTLFLVAGFIIGALVLAISALYISTLGTVEREALSGLLACGGGLGLVAIFFLSQWLADAWTDSLSDA